MVDDRLRLIFTCCHPALALEARVALTLRTVAGVPTADIARAFLVSESTMTRRLTRAKTKIAAAGIPYRVPTGPALAERLPGVLAVLYLLFTQGYDADGEPGLRRRGDPAGPAARPADAGAARGGRSARAVPAARTPAGPPAATPTATCSPSTSRTAPAGTTPPSPRAWPLLDRAGHGPYALQARIAACHATAPTAADTDWPAIAGLVRPTRAAPPDPGGPAQPGGGARFRVRARRPGWRCSPRPARAAPSTATRRRWPRRPSSPPGTATGRVPPRCSGPPPPLVSSTAERTALVRRADDLTAGGP